ncbi:MAG: response regulator [Bdellovibrionales bacterium]|nr:response regulator [Bdellovibrionales bacterium]
MRFLIVDDDEDILKIIRVLLQSQGHDVEPSTSALEAMKLLKRQEFDLVITDATMPAHSGFDLIRTIRKDKNLKHLTIAMLTGRREREDIEQAVEVGVEDYIVKPIDPKVLMEKVDRLIKKHKKKMEDLGKHQPTPSRLSLDCMVTRVTDVGITIEGPVFFQPGCQVEIDVEILKKAGIEKNKFKTIYSKELKKEGYYATDMVMLGLNNREKKILDHLASKDILKVVS